MSLKPLVRVTLVPIDSKKPNVGPFDCLEARSLSAGFYWTGPDGGAHYENMQKTPYMAVAEPLPSPAEPPRRSLDAWEDALVSELQPAPHAQAFTLKDGTVATFVGPHALVLSQLFQAAIRDEGLT